jgi:tetratricopeptide (TPR) repeat protein
MNLVLVGCMIAVASLRVVAQGGGGERTRAKVMVAWPVDASGRGADSEWFGALAAHQLWFRLGASKDLEVLPLEESRLVSASRARKVARERGASYALLQSYELLADQRSVHYYAEVVAVERDLNVIPVEKTFPVEQIGTWVDSCALRFAAGIELPMSTGLRRFFSIPAINVPLKTLKSFGRNAAGCRTASPAEAIVLAREHKAIVDADPRNLLAHYLAAKAYLAAGEHARGAEILKDFLTVVPSHAGLYLDAARSFRMCGQYPQTLEMAAMAEKQGIRDPALLCEGAEALVKLGREWKAARVYEEVLAGDSTQPQALLHLARKYTREYKPAKALEYTRRLIEAHPHNAPGHFEQGKAYMAMEDWAKAIASFEQSLQLEPNTDVFYPLGLCHDHREDYAKAIDAYRRYLTANPNHEDAIERMAADYIHIGDKHTAAEHTLELYALDSTKHTDRLARAAFLFEEAGSIDRARELFARCVKAGHCGPRVNVHLARIEFDRKRYEVVVELLEGVGEGMVRDQGLVSILARSYNAIGKHTEAIPWLRELIATKPNDPEPIRCLAVAYEKSANADLAIHTYQQLLNVVEDGSRADYAFRIGELYEQGGDRAKAIEVYRDNTTRFAGDSRNYANLAKLYIETHSWAEARELLIEMINFSGSEPRYRKMLAEVCARQNDRVAAARSYHDYLELVSDDVEAWKGLGDVHFERQLYVKAAQSYRRAAEFVEDDYHTTYRLGICLLNTGDPAAAMDELQRAHRIDAKNAEVLEALAEAARRAHDRQVLCGALDKQRALKPEDAVLRMELGELLAKEGELAEAMAVMEEAARIRPSDAAIHVRLARGYERLGNDNAQFSHLKAALEADGDDAGANLAMGRFYYKRGTLNKAGEHLAQAMDSDPSRPDIRYAYARLLYDTDLKTEALEHAAWAATKASYKPTYLLLYAQIAAATGRKELALATVEDALRIDTDDVELLSFAGSLYKEAGRAEEAKRWLLRAVSLDDGCGGCYRLLGEIFLGENLYTRATSYLRRALDEQGYDERTAMMLGNAFRKSMEYERAREMFEKVLDNNRKQNEARYHLVHLAFRAGNVKLARELERRFSRREKTLWHHLAAGELQEAQHDMDAAMISYGVALRLKPDCSEALAGFGRVNIARKKYQEAIVNIGKAMVGNPYDPYLTVDLGRAYEGMGDLTSAAEFYKEVVKNYPQVSDAYYRLAGALSRMEKYRKAMSVINEGLSRCPHCPKLYMALGREYRRMGRHEEALKVYHEAVRRGGDAFVDAYMHIATIYANDLRNEKNAQRYFKKYLKAGGRKEEVKKQMAILGM